VSNYKIRFNRPHTPGKELCYTILIVFVDRVGLRHQLDQAVAIVILAVFLFFVRGCFVFAGRSAWTNSR
jgi:hypothetical protein